MAIDLNEEPAASDDEEADIAAAFQVHQHPVAPAAMEEEANGVQGLFDLNIADGNMSDDDYGVYVDHVEVVFEEEELQDSSDEEEDVPENQQGQSNHTCRTNLTNSERQQIYEAVLLRSKINFTIGNKTTTIVAALFNVNRSYVQAIWRRAKKCFKEGVPVDVSSKRCNSGRKKVDVNLSQVPSIPLNKRSTIRSLAEELHVKKSTLHNAFKAGKLRRHSNTLKPSLNDSNKKDRLQYCASMIDAQTNANEPNFHEMRNIVHIDEKWFNTTKKARKFYMLPDEEDPLRTVHNKNSIDKVMLLSAVARPHYDEQGNCIFNGKIGIWPFTRKEPAQRNSINRPRGTLVTKTMIVTRDTSRSFMIAKVIPAIATCWPREHIGQTIWIQQDNARTHVPPDDPAVALAIAQTSLDIRIMNQPANSPDMNVLDLGFFASLQSLTYRSTARNLDELVSIVEKEYNDYDHEKLNRVFLTLQSCLVEVMMKGGGNRYKIPHMYKDGLERTGTLPRRLGCPVDLYQEVIEKLQQ